MNRKWEKKLPASVHWWRCWRTLKNTISRPVSFCCCLITYILFLLYTFFFSLQRKMNCKGKRAKDRNNAYHSSDVVVAIRLLRSLLWLLVFWLVLPIFFISPSLYRNTLIYLSIYLFMNSCALLWASIRWQFFFLENSIEMQPRLAMHVQFEYAFLPLSFFVCAEEYSSLRAMWMFVSILRARTNWFFSVNSPDFEIMVSVSWRALRTVLLFPLSPLLIVILFSEFCARKRAASIGICFIDLSCVCPDHCLRASSLLFLFALCSCTDQDSCVFFSFLFHMRAYVLVAEVFFSLCFVFVFLSFLFLLLLLRRWTLIIVFVSTPNLRSFLPVLFPFLLILRSMLYSLFLFFFRCCYFHLFFALLYRFVRLCERD